MKADVLRRIALTLEIVPQGDPTSAALRVSNAESEQPLLMNRRYSLLLTLEHEPEATFVRGHVRLLGDNASYPVQSNVALFEALADYIARAEGGDERLQHPTDASPVVRP